MFEIVLKVFVEQNVHIAVNMITVSVVCAFNFSTILTR